jgi:kumamolisin
MPIPEDYKPVQGTDHAHPKDHKLLNPTGDDTSVTATIILRRRPGSPSLRKVEDFAAARRAPRKHLARGDFAPTYGADPKELENIAAFARSHGLEVVESDQARRDVVVRGSAAAVNKAFGVELNDYESPRGKYRSHIGTANLPGALAHTVEAVVGLDNRPVPAQHYSTARRRNPKDPPNTKPVTPQQVAQLYNFPDGDGSGQTIGIYEMATQGGPAGYSLQDLTDTMQAFGGGLKVPSLTDVSIDGVTNSGVSDGETGLDITVAGAVAQGAQIAVYFTGGTTQSIIHALQQMIHPGAGDPEPAILSISYGFGADDETADSFSQQEYTQIDKLFQDAANLGITVLVSSGDSGAFIPTPTSPNPTPTTQAQTSYPATEPWVIACGGTTVGNINGTTFDEYVWNDRGAGGPGATGGGISAKFPVPNYQNNAGLPSRIGSGKVGRGVPDIAGNASENSGYIQFINGESQPVGGTSAVAPLYAGLIALINANLGVSVGFINPTLYAESGGLLRDISGPPGPANNSFEGVEGYSASAGWNACTGLGSVNGAALENALQTAAAAA